MKAIGHYVIVSIEKEKEKKTKSGIVMLADSQQSTTNSGDKIGTNSIYKVYDIGSQVELSLQKDDEVILNPWEVQLFEKDEKTYAVVPDLAIKVVL